MTPKLSLSVQQSQGIVDPHELVVWHQAGAAVVVHPWLHAKVIAAEFGSDETFAVVGSANATVRSDRDLEEAVLISRDRAVFDEVRNAVLEWRSSDDAKVVDDVWLERAIARFKSRKAPPARRAPTPPPLTPHRLMVSEHERTVFDLPPAAQAKWERLRQGDATSHTEVWTVSDEPNLELREGDTLILVNSHAGDDGSLASLSGRRRVNPPGVVRHILKDGNDRYVYYRSGADRFDPITLAALRRSGLDVPWQIVGDDRVVNDGIVALFPPQRTRSRG